MLPLCKSAVYVVKGFDFCYRFVGVLVALLALALSVAGTIILRKHRTPQHHGFLVGVSGMMSFGKSIFKISYV